MSRIGLAAFTLNFREKHAETPDWLVMNRGGAFDAWDIINKYLASKKRKLVDLAQPSKGNSGGRQQRVSKAFELTKLKPHSKANTFAGIIEAGDYGRASNIRDIESGRTTHHKGLREADMPPFYFRIHVPDGSDTAVFILQNIGIHGLKSAVEPDLRRHFSKSGFTMKVAALADEQIVKAFLTHGYCKELRVSAKRRPTESRDLLHSSRINEQHIPAGVRLDVVLKQRDGFAGVMKKIVGVIDKKTKPSELVRVYGLDEPEEITCQVDLEGQTKTFKLLHPGDNGIPYDITDDVEMDANNHPTFDSLDKLARAWCRLLLRQESIALHGN